MRRIRPACTSGNDKPHLVVEVWAVGTSGCLWFPRTIVGCPRYAVILCRAGTGWPERTEIGCITPVKNDHFGIAVAIDGPNAYVGGMWVSRPLHVHPLANPQMPELLQPPPGCRNLGTALAITSVGRFLASSLDADSATGLGSGAVYFFSPT